MSPPLNLSGCSTEDTIRLALDLLMTNGLKNRLRRKTRQDYNLCQNHRHAEKILEVFGKEYPYLPGYAKVTDNYMTCAQSAIDEFSTPAELPQIAISVDMLDTGHRRLRFQSNVFRRSPEARRSSWQMIGRGTALRPV